MIVYEYGNPDSVNILIQMVDEHDLSEIEEEVKTICGMAGEDFCLKAIKVDDWNRDLSPWQAPAVFGDMDFGGGAQKTLEEVLDLTVDRTRKYYIGGYSLAGLFALWAASQSDVFEGTAAASPSLWFPGFTDYLREHPIKADHVYLSLGDREEKTRNPVMRTVGSCIRECHELLQEQGVNCILEWNKGNHFQDAGARTGKGFGWVLSQGSNQKPL